MFLFLLTAKVCVCGCYHKQMVGLFGWDFEEIIQAKKIGTYSDGL